MRRISIIIPALNEAEHLCATLSDLAPLRVAGHELILADGGSHDGTPDLASPLVDKIIQTRSGRAVQMNAGAQAACGDILWFLHADSRIPENATDTLLQSQREWGRFDISLSGRHPLLRIVEKMMNLRSRLTGIATGDQGIFVIRKAFEAIGGYPDIPLMEDIALSKALRRRSRPACLRTRLITSSRRWEQHGILSTIALMWRLRLAYALGTDPSRLAKHYRKSW